MYYVYYLFLPFNDQPTSDALVQRLYSWAEKGGDPLQTYATLLIAAAMEVQDIANMTR